MCDALLLVDVQNDFLPPRGSLAVPSGDLVVPHVLDLLSLPFAIVVASQDFHPANHVSFASSHPASQRRPFESIRLPHPVTRVESDQDLWPDHCVQDTSGAELEPRVSRAFETWVANGKGTLVRKGQDVELDAYSAFAKPLALLRQEHERQNHSDPPLTTILKQAKTQRLFVAGLATDYCVRASVLSALEEAASLPESQRWEVYVVREAVRGVHADREDETLRELETRGARIVDIGGPELAKLRR